MEIRPFKEKASKPNEALLKKALKDTFEFYNDLMTQTKEFKKEWNFSKTSGWMQKIADSKKALLYVIPLEGFFKINLTVRKEEREKLLANKTLISLHPQLKDAKKYSEGYLLSFPILKKSDAGIAASFIDNLIIIRT